VQRLGALAEKGQCEQAMEGLSQLGHSQSGMSFTQDGLDPMIAAAHTQYQIATIDRTCKHSDAAAPLFRKLADSKIGGDIVWADAAARMLPGYDVAGWHVRLMAALAESKSRAQSSSNSMYNIGLLEQALGIKAGAQEAFHNVFLLPDQKLSSPDTIRDGRWRNELEARRRSLYDARWSSLPESLYFTLHHCRARR
jgi:hypothetical protein